MSFGEESFHPSLEGLLCFPCLKMEIPGFGSFRVRSVAAGRWRKSRPLCLVLLEEDEKMQPGLQAGQEVTQRLMSETTQAAQVTPLL